MILNPMGMGRLRRKAQDEQIAKPKLPLVLSKVRVLQDVAINGVDHKAIRPQPKVGDIIGVPPGSYLDSLIEDGFVELVEAPIEIEPEPEPEPDVEIDEALSLAGVGHKLIENLKDQGFETRDSLILEFTRHGVDALLAVPSMTRPRLRALLLWAGEIPEVVDHELQQGL